MNERIALIRKQAGLTQGAFGARIGGLSRNYVWMLEKGEREPSDRTVADICREFNVSEVWLRTGEGEMFLPKSYSEELEALICSAQLDPDGLRAKFLSALARLDERQLETLAAVARALVDEVDREAAPAPARTAEDISRAVAEAEALYEKSLGLAPRGGSSASPTTAAGDDRAAGQ